MNSLDILKYLVLANGLVLVIQSVRVVSLYSSVYALSDKDWRRQLPLHVWLMALSFAIYVGASTYFIIAHPHNTLARLLIYGLAGGIAQYGLFNVLQYDRRRYSRATHFRDPGEAN